MVFILLRERSIPNRDFGDYRGKNNRKGIAAIWIGEMLAVKTDRRNNEEQPPLEAGGTGLKSR
jgi:hypothetical protein